MSRDPIAIIGIGCRFPGGADGVEAYWRILRDGVDAICEVPADRWSIAAHFDPVPGRVGKSITRWGGFVDGIDRFDPGFFGISPREAEFMDPQQRLLLETAWEALEDAGHPASALRGSPTGVFVGISTHDYELLQTSPEERSELDIYSTTGGTLSIAANRISYCLDLRGPSLAVDTACSSSLVALHMAALALERGDCTLALVGGVNALLAPMPFVAFSRMSMLSPTGRCRAFDAGADGFVRGEGAGIVVLKPLAAARAAGDRIYAVIRGTAANQDGRTNGITVPSATAQAALALAACRVAGIEPTAIAYAEAHGTGTQVGDPIEATALGEALGSGRPGDRPLVVGSAKTNVGHLEAGAGMAGLVKLALVLSRGEIPPNLHFREPNPHIDFERLKLRIPVEREDLERGRDGTFGCINSFGFGGSNAHAVLEAPPAGPRPRRRPPREPSRARLLPLSAPSGDALRATAERWREMLADGSSTASLDEICWTAGARRTHHAERLAVVGKSRAELAERLEAFMAGAAAPGLVTGSPVDGAAQGIVFVFSGQGPQWWGMGRELFRHEPIFRARIEEIDAILASFARADWRLVDELARGEGDSRLAETRISQPAIFALQAGLAALLESWGIRPAAAVGHSVGEVAAAHVAGVLGLREATHVIFERGRCMDLAPERGRMLAVQLSAEEAEAAIRPHADRIAVGAVNAPASVTLSGDGRILEALARDFEARQIFCRFVPVEYAFHSPQMDPIESELLRSLAAFPRAPARIPLISTVDVAETEGAGLDAAYWWRNVRETVRFGPAIDLLVARGFRLFLEIGAHPALSAAIGETLRRRGGKGAVVATLRRREPERATLLQSAGALHVAGAPLDWRGIHPEAVVPAKLPGTAWQKERYWHESRGSAKRRLDPAEHPFLGREIESLQPGAETWLDRRAMPYLEDHRVQGHVIFPASGYLEVALETAARRFGEARWLVEDVDFVRSLVLPDGDEVPRLQITLDPADSRFTIATAGTTDEWTLHGSGKVRKDVAARAPAAVALAAIRRRCAEVVAVDECYRRFRAAGLAFGPAFRGIAGLWRAEDEALGRIAAPAEIARELGRYRIHPALLDACFQVLSAALPATAPGEAAALYLPVHVDRLRLHRTPPGELWSHARLVRRGGNAIVGEIRILDDEGQVVAEIEGFRCQGVIKARGTSPDDPETWLYETRWQPRPLPHGAPADAGFLPVPSALAAAARGELRRRQKGKSSRARFLALEADLDRLCLGYVLAALAELGWKPRVGERVDAPALAKRLGVAARHRAVLGRFLELLAEDGVLAGPSEQRRVRRVPRAVDVVTLWRTLLERFPALHPELTLLGRAGRALPAILRGKTDPLAVLAPAGSLAVLEHFYQDSPSAVDYNQALAAAVAEAAARAPDGRVVRILEIGAGTGGTTAHVVPRLRADRSEYVFTDVSAAFFAKAEQKFFEFPFLRCQLLDVERSPADQGFEPGSYDIVIAADALHATARLEASLGFVRELLAPGGELVLLEIDRPTRWIDLVFGLTPGWWRFRDRALRPHHPLLSAARWADVLRASGFTTVASAADAVAPERSGQSVIVARAPVEDVARGNPSANGKATRTEERWLVFADAGGRGQALAETLAEEGARVTMTLPLTPALSPKGEGVLTSPHRGEVGATAAGEGEVITLPILPGSPDDMRELIAGSGADFTGVVHLWSLDAPPAEGTTLATLRESEVRGCHTVLDLVQRLSADPSRVPPRLHLVTRGAHAVGDRVTAVSPAQAPLWAFGRVIQNEHRRLGCRMIDLDPAASAAEDLAALHRELGAADGEEEVAWRGSLRYANRLVHTSLEQVAPSPAAVESYRLEVPAPGAITGLRLTARPRRRPGPGEVEIEVAAAALNFRDVMKALGIYPIESDRDLLTGDECAGRIVALGKGVTGFREGDRVIALDAGCFAAHKTVDAGVVAPMPPGLFFEEAVTIPVAFSTSWYALHHLGRIQAGETVLVHAATGGVGLSALQIIRAAGARAIATAGSPEKRELLRALGVDQVFDSRSLAFAEQVREATDGRGVDLVLNSLAGEAIGKSLETLAPHGRFLEIGKRDIYQDTRVGLRPFRHGLSFFAIDMQQVMKDDPALTRRLVAEFLRHFRTGVLRPLPYRAFPISEIGAAFRLMAKAQHVGKIVVSTGDDRVRPHLPSSPRRARLAANATYLVTGGLGGFGLALADWMVANGARHLVLAGRSGAATAEAKDAVARLRRRGARVVVARADVADPASLDRVLARIDRSLPKLRGVVHAAMVLDDGLLAELDAARFRRVMAPKVDGAWNLHRATLDRKLDFFVMFSSVSAIVGAPAQGNYVAANGFLDALAHHRRALGLPALTVNWGGLAEVGYVARHERVEEHLTRQGILGIPPGDALELLGRFLDGDKAQVGVVRVDWQRWASFLPAVATAPRFSEIFQAGAAEKGAAGVSVRQSILDAAADERPAMVVHHLREQVARVLRTAAAKLDTARPLGELGVDSLMGFELVNQVESEFQLSLPPSKLAGGATIERIAAVLLEALSASSGNGTARSAGAAANGAAAAEVEVLASLRPGAGRPPLFCVHPAGGLGAIYRHLAEALPADLPVVAVQSRALGEGSTEHASLRELADAYASRLLAYLPGGPFRLVGFSLGGIFALATAQALEERGARVELLGLIDADLLLTARRRRDDDYVRGHVIDMYGTFARELGIVRRLDDGALADEAAELARRVLAAPPGERSRAIVGWLAERGHMVAGLSPALLGRYFTLFDAHLDLIEGYRAATIAAPLLFWGSAADGNGHADRAEPWRGASTAGLTHTTLPASHYQLMYPPHVERIAAELDAALRRGERGTTGERRIVAPGGV